MYRRKKNIIIMVMLIAIVFMSVGYSILRTELKITGGANITSTWDVRITGITNNNSTGSAYNLEEPSFTNDTAKFKVILVNPGDSMTYTVTIENKGTLTAVLNGMNITTSGTDAIIYEVSGVKEGDTLAAGGTKTLTVVARYNSNVIADPYERAKTLKVGLEWLQYTNQTINPGTYTINYNSNGGSGNMVGTTCTVGSSCTLATNTFTKDGYALAGWATTPTGAYIYTDGQSVMNLTSKGKTITLYAVWREAKLLATYILANNNAQADTSIDFSAISSDTNGKGLYYTSTNTEDNKTTYYFRGAVDNNYVQFGTDANGNDLYWRIVRINEDGSIRLVTEEGVVYGLVNINTDDNTYVGYMYGTARSSTYALTHTNTNDSTIKGVLDDWYEANLKNSYGSYLADAGFCNDRSVAPSAGLWASSDTALGYRKNDTVYGATGRLANIDDRSPKENAQPQFACPNASNDLFTLKGSNKGNKALDNPIGLLTMDEVAYAGGVYSRTNESMYLSGAGTWTMSPSNYTYVGADAFAVNGESYGYDKSVGDSNLIRPVINLRSDVEITSATQNGTSTNYYVIKTN